MTSTRRVGILLTSPPGHLQAEYITPFEEALTAPVKARDQSVEFLRAYASRHLTNAGDIRKHAANLVACKPDVIWVISTASAEAALEADTGKTIPVVGSAVNLRNSKTVEAAAQKGGNFAGVLSLGPELGVQRLRRLDQILKVSGKSGTIGVLVDASHAGSAAEFKAFEGQQIAVKAFNVTKPDALASVLKDVQEARVIALMTTHAPIFQNRRAQILQFCAEQMSIPLVGHRTFFVEDGALLAESSDLRDQMRRSAELVAAILRGGIGSLDDKDRIQQSRKTELAINLVTAAELELTVPDELLQQAHRLISNCDPKKSSSAKA